MRSQSPDVVKMEKEKIDDLKMKLKPTQAYFLALCLWLR
jgi:hypothetical protein